MSEYIGTPSSFVNPPPQPLSRGIHISLVSSRHLAQHTASAGGVQKQKLSSKNTNQWNSPNRFKVNTPLKAMNSKPFEAVSSPQLLNKQNSGI